MRDEPANEINRETDKIRYYTLCRKDELDIAVDGSGGVPQDIAYYLG
ncbi:MAG: hypothetical protein WC091_16565 [Sulfuricellaceae bacterium]